MGENYIVFSIGNQAASSECNSSSEKNVNSSGNNNDLGTINDINTLNVKIFSGKIRHDILSFTPSKSPFTIGRSADCDILLDDGMLSRFHSTIQFKDGQWYVNDGYMQENGEMKRSTNGTWIYCLEDTPIENGTTFKANHNLFICNYSIPNGNAY